MDLKDLKRRRGRAQLQPQCIRIPRASVQELLSAQKKLLMGDDLSTGTPESLLIYDVVGRV